MQTTTLITGASSGIGFELSELFARDGHNLVLVARNRQKLEQRARALREQYGVQVRVMIKDLAITTSPDEIFAELERESIQVDILVNNAGTQVYGLFAEADLTKNLQLLQVNLTALTHLTGLFLPGMLERGRGRILNVASTGAFAPSVLNAVYCASKAYVLSFSEAIAAELVDTGVTVTVLCPGATDTAFVQRHGLERVRLFRNMMSATEVAEIGYQALMKGRRVVVAGLGNQLMVLMLKLNAPFMPLMPTRMVKQVGAFIMGKA